MQQPLVTNRELDEIPQPYGDDKVHFDPIRAIQSIKLTNNYRTAQSNDNFLSTVILNTYFFNNTVLHHSEINEPPPKLPYDSTDYQSSSSNSSLSSSQDGNEEDTSSSMYEYCSDESDESDDDDDDDASSNSISDDTKLDDDDDEYPLFNHIAMDNENNENNKRKRHAVSSTLTQLPLQHASSTPNAVSHMHRKSPTLNSLHFVASKIGVIHHTANPHKASQILGINSDAVLFANKQRKSMHRCTSNQEVMDPDDDEFVFKALKFDEFKPQKRNIPTRRSNTIDLGPHKAKTLITDDVFDEKANDNIRSRHSSMIAFTKSKRKIKRKRPRLSMTKSAMGESSDVIEIKFKIDRTKKGYMFVGIIPANKINNVVQPGFMFGFNPYTYCFHGYSGKLYHDKLESEYYFNTNRKNQHKIKHNKANTVDVTSGIADITAIERKESEQKENDNDNRHTILHKDKHRNTNKKLPVLKSGDIVTLKMKLNRNHGKFTVIYCINGMDYGIAWKNIDPPVTIGITMVGRKEQITLISCTYRPYKNDKSCVIL